MRYLRESTVSERISVMGETIPDESQFSLLYVLFDRIQILVLWNFLFGVRPTGDFYHHVENLWGSRRRGRKEGDIVPGGDGYSILLKVNAVLESVGGAYIWLASFDYKPLGDTNVTRSDSCHCMDLLEFTGWEEIGRSCQKRRQTKSRSSRE